VHLGSNFEEEELSIVAFERAITD